MKVQHNILLAFYGDDLTGSTDALESITNTGARAVLFFHPPGEEQLKKFAPLDAYGIAGNTRALSPGAMRETLIPVFRKMLESGAAFIHYKVCSTFDSSANVGSIGCAIECAMEIYEHRPVSIFGGTPALGRYCAFGNLFARMGTQPQGPVYRLDRHPSMSKHPVTPTNESDLRVHLAKQTGNNIDLIDITGLQRYAAGEPIQTDAPIVLIDGCTNDDLDTAAELVIKQSDGIHPVCIVGGSSIENALGKAWRQQHLLREKVQSRGTTLRKPLLVVSGSCSPVTAAQIAFANQNGFAEVVIDTESILDKQRIDDSVTNLVVEKLHSGQHLVVHTGKRSSVHVPSEVLGKAFGEMIKAIVSKIPLQRIIVAGGDTSSYTAAAMDLTALEILQVIVPGAPLCKAYSDNKMINGLELSFKGGQVGSPSCFIDMTK